AVPRADPDGQLASTKGNIAGRNKSGPDTGQRARTPSNNKEKTTSGGPNPDAGLSFPFWPRLKDGHHMIGNWMAESRVLHAGTISDRPRRERVKPSADGLVEWLPAGLACWLSTGKSDNAHRDEIRRWHEVQAPMGAQPFRQETNDLHRHPNSRRRDLFS